MAEGQLSVFPGAYDQFINHQEIGSSDISDIATFESLQLIANKTDAQIAQYNSLLTQYRTKIFLAQDLNQLTDCIYQMETFIKTNFVNYYRYRGVWTNTPPTSDPYRIFNSVKYNGNTYLAIVDYPTNAPSDPTQWLQNSSDGSIYSLNIVGTVGTIIYDENGYNPSPTMSTLSCVLYEDGIQVTPTSYSWTVPSSNTLLSGSSTISTFTPAISSSFNVLYGNNIVTLNVVYNSQTFIQHYPIAITKVGTTGAVGASGVGLVFKGAYNDQTIYHVNECVEYLGSIYACLQDVQGVLPTNQTYWNIAISKGGSTILTTYRNTVTLTSDATNVAIGISYFNQYTDTLLVYQQGIYINPTVDYRINANGTSIDKTDSTAWTNGTIFGFVVIKNVVSDMTYADGGMLQDGTVTESKLTSDLQDKLNNNSFTIVKSNYTADSDEISEVPIGNSLYNPSTDDLKVKYLNEILTEGVNYTVLSDNLNIELLDWVLNNGDIVYFEITKKSINPITQLDGALIQENSIPITKLTQGLQDEINGKANESDLVLHEAESTKYSTYKSNKDSNGIYTTVQLKRSDSTLYVQSVLSGGASPNYSNRTETWYKADGTTIDTTKTYTRSYDNDGLLISEVMA